MVLQQRAPEKGAASFSQNAKSPANRYKPTNNQNIYTVFIISIGQNPNTR